jgi:hypothetical protein
MIEVCIFAFHIPKLSHHKSSILNTKQRAPSTSLFESKEGGIEIVGTPTPPLPGDDRLQSIELSDELKNSFMSYAMSTILGRCLPDARDGMLFK